MDLTSLDLEERDSILRNVDKENSDGVKIPKIIMQTWKNKVVPTHWESSPKSIKTYMSDWNYVMMTDEDNLKFMETYYPKYVKIYNELPYPICRADMIRAAFLHRYGGLYMDMDIQLKGSLNELFKADAPLYLVTSGNVGSVITNSMMAAKPGVEIWLTYMRKAGDPLPWYYIG